jgi:hypothetical protein
VAVYGFVQYPLFLQSIEWMCWILLASTSILGAGGAPAAAPRAAKVLVVLALLSLPLRWALLPPPSAAARDFGFHRPETLPDGRTVRWTSPRAGQRLAWEGEALVVELIDGHPSPEARPLEVSLEVPGIAAWRGRVGASWTKVHLEVGEPSAAWLALLIEARPSFRPYRDFLGRAELEPSRDIRSLGVVTGRVTWERFLLEDRTVTDRQSVRSEHFPILAGNLGAGDYVVGPTAAVTLMAPSVELANGFVAAGRLTIGTP